MGIDVDGKARRVVPMGEWRSWCAFPTVTPCNEPAVSGSGDRIGRPCLDRYYGGEILWNISLLLPIGSPGMHDPISANGQGMPIPSSDRPDVLEALGELYLARIVASPGLDGAVDVSGQGSAVGRRQSQ